MTDGVKPPIWSLKLHATSWQLLWWLIARMDGAGLVVGGWRGEAARDMGRDRLWVAKCARMLRVAGLIRSDDYERSVTVLVDNLRG